MTLQVMNWGRGPSRSQLLDLLSVEEVLTGISIVCK